MRRLVSEKSSEWKVFGKKLCFQRKFGHDPSPYWALDCTRWRGSWPWSWLTIYSEPQTQPKYVEYFVIFACTIMSRIWKKKLYFCDRTENSSSSSREQQQQRTAENSSSREQQQQRHSWLEEASRLKIVLNLIIWTKQNEDSNLYLIFGFSYACTLHLI